MLAGSPPASLGVSTASNPPGLPIPLPDEGGLVRLLVNLALARDGLAVGILLLLGQQILRGVARAR